MRFAHEHKLHVSVQSTGHGAEIKPAVAGGVLITTSRINDVIIHPETKTATVGAGVTFQQLIEKASEHKLFPVSGGSVKVGIVGFLLGGGLGPLVRSHGVSSDYVRQITLVTGNGNVVTASSTENPDLFWALRGAGKIGFGVVTSLELQLVELETVYGGHLMFAEDHIEAVFRGWVKWLGTYIVKYQKRKPVF